MVTESGDVNAGCLAGLQDGHTLGDCDRVTIDEDLDDIFGVREMDPGTSYRGAGIELGFGMGDLSSSLGLVEFRRGDNGAMKIRATMRREQ